MSQHHSTHWAGIPGNRESVLLRDEAEQAGLVNRILERQQELEREPRAWLRIEMAAELQAWRAELADLQERRRQMHLRRTEPRPAGPSDRDAAQHGVHPPAGRD